jgi:hypothetical protein
VLEYLGEEPVSWEEVLSTAEKRSIASTGTLNKVRTELVKSGEIIQIGERAMLGGSSLAKPRANEST